METDFIETSKFKAINIPEGWENSTVGKSLSIRNNLRFPISEEEREKIQGEYPYYGPTKVQGYVDHYRVEGKYALIGEDGDHFLKFKDLQMTLLVEGKFNVNNHAHIVEGTDQCTTEWFYYFFAHRDLFSHLTRQGAGRYKLTKDALQRLPIQLPPLPQQRKIAAILSTWDEAIQTADQLLKAKQERKRGLMQQVLTGQKRLPGFSEEWRKVKLEEVSREISTKNRHDKSLPVLSCTKYAGLVDSLEYFGRKIYSDDLSTYRIVPVGCFAYATNHIEEGSIGYQSKYKEALISPMYTVFKTDDSVHDEFMYAVLKTERYIQIYKRNMSGSIDRRGGLRWGDFSKIKVPLPTIEEQRAITGVLDAANDEIRLAKAEVEAFKQQKRGLMQQLLTGQKLVTSDVQEHQYDLLNNTPV